MTQWKQLDSERKDKMGLRRGEGNGEGEEEGRGW